MMVKELQDELKDKTRLLDKKDLLIESLNQTISNYPYFFKFFFNYENFCRILSGS
jgi:hypothetical protein